MGQSSPKPNAQPLALGQQTPQGNLLNAYQAPKQLAPVYTAPLQDMIQQQMPAVQSPNSVRTNPALKPQAGMGAHPFYGPIGASQGRYSR